MRTSTVTSTEFQWVRNLVKDSLLDEATLLYNRREASRPGSSVNLSL